MKWRYRYLRHAGLVRQSLPLFRRTVEGFTYDVYGYRNGGELTAQETYRVIASPLQG